MGPIFTKASSEIKSKIDILESLRKEENRNQFETFATMLEFEKSTGLLNKKEYVSGSRSLLRLHWALGKSHVPIDLQSHFSFVCIVSADFVREFLYGVSQLELHEKTIAACQTAYNNTLAKHHPWLVRKAAALSMYAMPTREQLLNKVCSNVDRTLEVLPDALFVAKDVFDRTEKLYTDHDLHALP